MVVVGVVLTIHQAGQAAVSHYVAPLIFTLHHYNIASYFSPEDPPSVPQYPASALHLDKLCNQS